MSQNTGQSSGTPHSRERIIPIQIEGEGTPTRSSLRLIKREEQMTNKQPTRDNEILNIVSEDSASADEGIVSASTKSSSSPEKQTEDGCCDSIVDVLTTIIDVPARQLPTFNVPEKIVIVLDRALDENCTQFEMMSGKKYSPLFMLQHALKLFLHNKAAIDNQHEFALIILNENSASWVHDFSNSPHDIIRTIQAATECEPEDIFNLNEVFDLINKKVELSPPKKDLLIPPSFVVRTVLLYGRSYSIPQLKRMNEIEKLLNSPYFTVDVVMTHEPPSSANHCDKIFKTLQEIDTKGFAYSFSVSRNASDLHLAMAKVLSHPLQRPHQFQARYSISSLSQ